MISKINKRLSEERGAIALEALLSIIILLILTSITWGLCILIFNFSIISTSTQLATQSGLMTYDRATYRGFDDTAAQIRGRAVAVRVFQENSCGTVRGQFGEGAPNSGCRSGNTPDSRFSIDFQCRRLGPTFGGWGSCANSSFQDTEMLRVSGRSNVTIPFSYLINNGRETGALTARVRSVNYSIVKTGDWGGP